MNDEFPIPGSSLAVSPFATCPVGDIPVSRSLIAAAAVVALVIFVMPLGIGFPLLDPDEGLHASIAQEMVERGDWAIPRFLGQPFSDKPILYSWTQAVSLLCLGDREAAVRLPGLMFGLLGAITTGLLAAAMFDRRTGWIAGLLYATTILPTAMAQAASHDVALAPWINLTLLLLWQSHRRTSGRTTVGCTVAAGFFLGLSILTKGLVGVAVVGLAYGGWLLFSGQVRWNVLARGSLLLLTAALVAAPWYLAVERQNPGYLVYYFVDRHLLGFATDSQRHAHQPWWYYLPILIGGGLPWIGYLPIAVRDSFERRRAAAQRAATERPSTQSPFPLLWCWLLGWPALLMLSRSKLATYLWPAFPPMAILVAVVWARLIAGTLGTSARQAFAKTLVSSSWTGPILLPATVRIAQIVFHIQLSWRAWLVVCIAAALAPLPLAVWRVAERQRDAAGAAAYREMVLAMGAVSMAAQFAAIMTLVLPPVVEQFSARDLAHHFNQVGQLPPRLWLAEQRVGSIVFYLEPGLRDSLRPDQIRALAAGQRAQLEAGHVVAVPQSAAKRGAPRIDLGDAPFQQVGHYRLYTLAAPWALPSDNDPKK
ncbi:MAG: glycosyltransferase family 39 protein [Thermoguttaceae bacterium]